MEFDEYDEKNHEVDTATSLHIRPGGNQAYVTVGAVREYFTQYGHVVDEVGYLTNVEESVLAFDLDADAGDVFSFVDSDSGGNLAIRGVLKKAFGIAPDDITETHSIELTTDEETGYVIADLKPVIEDATEAAHCEDCGQRCAHERALKTHRSRMHDGPQAMLKDGDLDDIDDDRPEGDDSWQELDEKARADGGGQ